MCIRDRVYGASTNNAKYPFTVTGNSQGSGFNPERYTNSGRCLLYTSDAADERSSVDLGGRRIIKKKTREDRGGGGRAEMRVKREQALRRTRKQNKEKKVR